jgi:hypothetical protein
LERRVDYEYHCLQFTVSIHYLSTTDHKPIETIENDPNVHWKIFYLAILTLGLQNRLGSLRFIVGEKPIISCPLLL